MAICPESRPMVQGSRNVAVVQKHYTLTSPFVQSPGRTTPPASVSDAIGGLTAHACRVAYSSGGELLIFQVLRKSCS
jgi:hypothetical protein